MKLAEKMMRAWTGCADHPDAELRLAAQQTHDAALRYNQFARPRGVKKITRRVSTALAPRLFKGHRV